MIEIDKQTIYTFSDSYDHGMFLLYSHVHLRETQQNKQISLHESV